MADRVPARLTVPTRRELRSFAGTVGGALVLLGALATYRGVSGGGTVLVLLGLSLAIAGLFVPERLGPAYRSWMVLALAISRVTTPLLMGIIFFVVLTPIGLLMRLLGRWTLKRPPSAATFWVDRPPGGRRSDLRRQF